LVPTTRRRHPGAELLNLLTAQPYTGLIARGKPSIEIAYRRASRLADGWQAFA